MTIKPTVEEDAGRRISARRDFVLIVLVAAAAYYLSAKFNLSEALLQWSRPLERLGLSPKTAANHQSSIKQKLGATSALQLMLIAQRFGLVSNK